ncbi:GBS Bsp-like repeat-containing protein, partial [Undibacterium sp. CY21W]|uniref:GBS Bsp-like repeat-containing protein n=1 Tax=Undibacterium sp. CY21W TaxID=2762293 RepID=UPI00164C59E9
MAAPYNPNAPRLTVTRTPAPLVAGQPYSVYWSAGNAESLSYSCSSSGTGFTGEGEVPLNGQSSGLAEPGWVGYPTTCIWTAVGADGSSSSAVDYFATNPAPLPAPTCQSVYAQASTTSATSGTFRIFATGVQNASAVSFPTWGDSGGQDDLVWYPGTNLGGGTWIADINLSNHKQGNPEFGNFNTHAYASNADNSNTFCGYTNWSRVQPLTPPSLNFSACSTNSPTVGPTAASMSCTLNNAGQTPATSISYSSLPGIHVQGPNSCAAGATCGTVLVTTDSAAGSYSGTLTAVPNAGNSASVTVGLVVRQAPTINVIRTPSPMVANQSHYIQWQTTNAASVSYRCTASGSGYQGSGNLTPVNGTSTPTLADPLWVGFDSTCVYTATSPEGVTATFTETLKTNPAPVIVDPQPTINIIRTPSPMVANQNQTLQWQTSNAVSLTYRCTSTGTGFQGSGSLTPLNGTGAPSLADPGWVGFDSTCVYTATSASGKTASYTEILKTTRAATVGAMPAAALQATPTNVRVNSGSTTPIVLTGSGSDSDGYIARLDLFQDSGNGDNGSGYSATPINTVTANSANATISHTQLLGAGLYRFKLRSTDNNGNFTESAPVIVNVTNSSLLGQVNGVRSDNSGNVTLNGWVCEDGNSQALNYQVYVKAPPNLGGQLLASGVANIATEKDTEAVQAQCHTPGISHHFQMDLNSYSAQYAGETVYVVAQTGNNSILLPCSDNNCTVPGSLRIGLTTPVDGDHYTGVANVFMRAKLSNAAAPYDEIAFGIDNEWIAGAADTAADTYFANKTGLAPRSTPYLVMAKVRKGNSTVYSVANRIYVDGVVATTLTVNSPANGASVTSGAIVNLSATFTGTAGSVKFYANDILIASGTNNGGQWTAQWVAGAAASYAITAKAFDGAGTLLTTSPATNLTVTATPDSGTGALLPVNITPPHLGNPDAGTLPGSLDVNKNGGATYSMAIDVPPGTGGLQPQLTLNYDSQGNNSVLGLGWSLGGLSSIHRCGKTIAQDDVNGRISFDHGDRLCLDGQRLILANLPLTDDNYWADNAEYRTEIESFSRITAQGSGNQRSFKVESKDGRVMSFGNTKDSFVQAIVGPVNSGTTAPQPQQKNGAQSWAISEMRDRSGNYVRFSYEQDDKTGEHHATFIRYGGNGSSSHAAVQLTYEGRPDAWKRYIDESRNDLRQRITHIKTYTGNNLDGDVSASGTIVRDYTMHYEQSPTSGRSLLNSVSACARNPQTGGMDCLPATTFAWGKPDPGKTPGFESKGIWAGAPTMS